VKLQLDTTISFHRLIHSHKDDKVTNDFAELVNQAQSVHASTYTKKEFAFSLINDCCAFQAHLYTTKSFLESYKWIHRYGYYRPRSRTRMCDMLAQFVFDKYGSELVSCDAQTKDRILAQRLFEYLRTIILDLWERFDEGLYLPLDDRTKCPFAWIGPIEKGRVFKMDIRSSVYRCNGSEGCTLKNMLKGKAEKRRAIKLLNALRIIPDAHPRKTSQLKKIEEFLEEFFENGLESTCYEKCNSGIGDLIIALETLADRTLVTTNAQEYEIICPAISQDYRILPMQGSVHVV